MSASSVDPVILIAADKFKGSLTAGQVGQAIACGLSDGLAVAAPDAVLQVLSLADGGDGTLEALQASGFTSVSLHCSGPLLEPVESKYVVRQDLAVVEMAAVCGLLRLPAGCLAPVEASSFGLGEAIGAALDAGYREIVVAVGGSASNDGGLGMLAALGAKIYAASGAILQPTAAVMAQVERIELTDLHPGLAEARVTLASDVDNPLLGPNGAVAVFGSQKGVTEVIAEQLEAGLANWAAKVEVAVGKDFSKVPGAGAAGGVGFAALAVLGAQMRPGIELLMELTGFQESLRAADLLITGEGSLDEQTLRGKVVAGVGRAARDAGVPAVAVAGRISLSPRQLAQIGIMHARALSELEPDIEKSMANAGSLLTELSRESCAELLAVLEDSGEF